MDKGSRRSSTLRFRLTLTLIGFALIITGLLWLMQAVFLPDYYERSMERKATGAVDYVSSLYADSEELDLDEYKSMLEETSRKNDMYIYVESEDGDVSLSSDSGVFGMRPRGDQNAIDEARARLYFANGESVSFKSTNGRSDNVLITVSRVDSEYRDSVYVYSFTTLTPMGPAVEIIKAQLLWATLISIAIAALIAVIWSRRLARPVIELSQKAEFLRHGEYDVDFRTDGYREIEQLGEVLTDAAEELEKSSVLQKDLIANVSHDLRTPLTMIKSYAELIRDIYGENEQKRNESLGVIIEETDRLSDLVSDLLTLSKLQSGSDSLDKQVFDLVKSAENIFKVYKVLENDGYRLELEKPEGELLVNGDERRLQQVISNLISNAVRYSDEVKDISVKLERTGGRVRCSVNDCGIGIDEEDLKTIWNRYQKASRQGARGHKGGTGLGLSIAKEILELHGAKYGVSSTPGVGSCFWFELPLVRPRGRSGAARN